MTGARLGTAGKVGVVGLGGLGVLMLATRRKKAPAPAPSAGATIVAAPAGQSPLSAYGDLEPMLSAMRGAIAAAQQPPPNPLPVPPPNPPRPHPPSRPIHAS